MSAIETRRANATRQAMRERIEKANRPPTRSREGAAGEVIPFPVDCQRRFVENELISVRDYDCYAAYRWLAGVVRKHRSRLKQLGIAPDLVEADARALCDAFGIANSTPVPIAHDDLRSALLGYASWAHSPRPRLLIPE